VIERVVRDFCVVLEHFERREFIIVDDCSTDKTPAILRSLQDEYPYIRIIRMDRNYGYGPPVVRAFKEATGEYVWHCDSDNQFVAEDFWNLWDSLKREGLDVALGYRAKRNDEPHRLVLTFILRHFLSLAYRLHIRDSNSPFNLHARSALSRILPVIPHDAYMPSILMASSAVLFRLRVGQIPVRHLPRLTGRAWVRGLQIFLICMRTAKEVIMFLKKLKKELLKIEHARAHHTVTYNKKTIFVTVSRGSLIRNFFHSGVISTLLNNGFRVIVLTQYHKNTELFREYFHENLIFEPLFDSQRKCKKILEEIFKGAVFNKTVHAFYKYTLTAYTQPKLFFYVPRMICFAPLRSIPGSKWLARFIERTINPERQHDYLFKKYNPALVCNTAPGSCGGVLKSARRYGVRTVDIPKSWDNLSKMLFHIKADYLIVWNAFMARQALTFQGFKKEEIIVTGVPQFDFYARKEGLVSREQFCKQFKFDPAKKIIMYSSAGGVSCDEFRYVELIKHFIDEGALSNVQVLIRPHLGYRNDTQRFIMLNRYDGFAVDMTDKQNHGLKDHWDTSKRHIYHLFNSLYHTDVCVNLGSTLTLDAVACDTPVININFAAVGERNPNVARALHMLDYVQSVTRTGETWLAENADELLTALQNALFKNEKKETKNLIEHFIYKVDGNSAKRMANALMQLTN